MKTITLLLLAGFLSAEALEATATPAAAPVRQTSIMPETTQTAIFGLGANKRRKRKKSRPAYRRLGSYHSPAVRQTAA